MDEDISFMLSSIYGGSTSFMSIDEEDEALSRVLDSSLFDNCSLVLFIPTSPFLYEIVAAGVE